MRLLSVLAAGSQQLAQRILVRTAPAFACALSGTIGMGFATYAFFESMRLQYGVINASFELGGIYLIVAGILSLLSPRRIETFRQCVLRAKTRAGPQR